MRHQLKSVSGFLDFCSTFRLFFLPLRAPPRCLLLLKGKFFLLFTFSHFYHTFSHKFSPHTRLYKMLLLYMVSCLTFLHSCYFFCSHLYQPRHSVFTPDLLYHFIHKLIQPSTQQTVRLASSQADPHLILWLAQPMHSVLPHLNCYVHRMIPSSTQ